MVICLGSARLVVLGFFLSSSRTRFAGGCPSRTRSGLGSSRFFHVIRVLIEQSGLFVCFCHNFHFRKTFLLRTVSLKALLVTRRKYRNCCRRPGHPHCP